jgi:hypothetical protein
VERVIAALIADIAVVTLTTGVPGLDFVVTSTPLSMAAFERL